MVQPTPDVVPFVLGGPAWSRPTRRAIAAWLTVLTAFVIPLPGLFRGAGSTMEEAFMLVFPRELAAGKLPNRDFLHLYGPGALHVLAGWYSVVGDSLYSERAFGAAQLLAAVLAVFVLTRPWGYRASVPAALTMTVLLITPTGLAALAWPGAFAMALWSLVFGVRALHVDGRSRVVCVTAGGLLVGGALTYRPDLIVAIAIAWLIVLRRYSRAERVRFGGAAVVGLLPVWIHLMQVGIRPVWSGTITDPVFELRPGRRLPTPPTWGELDGALQALTENPVDSPWWGVPALSAPTQVFVWFFATVLLAALWLIAAVVLLRRGAASERTVLFAAIATFGFGIIGQAVQRPDSAHLAWGSTIALSLVPVVVSAALERYRTPSLPPSLRTWADRCLPVGTILLVVLLVAPFFTFRPYLLAARVTAGDRAGGYVVEREGRRFYVNNLDVQSASQQAVDTIGQLAGPDDRLFVGPADLSRTVYSDVMFYYLLHDLEPATYFIEMDPGIADAPDSGLADDVASADWLILTNFWTGWYEPNASTEFGSTEPNDVVADDFCLIGNHADGLVLVYRRCDSGDGVDPSTIGIGPERRASMDREVARRG